MITHVIIAAAALEAASQTNVTVRPVVSDVLVTGLDAVASNFDGGRPDEQFVYEADGGGP